MSSSIAMVQIRHVKAVDQILQYLKDKLGSGLLFSKGGSLTTDADYAGLVNYRRSTSGYCMFLGRN